MSGRPVCERSHQGGHSKLAAVLMLLGLSGCNVPFTTDSVYPIVSTAPGPVDPEPIHTAAPGDIVLSQPLVHAGFLELENTVSPRDRVWQGIWTYHPKMEQGLRLYPGFRVGGAKTSAVCSADNVTTGESNLGGVSPLFAVCLDLPDGALFAVPPGAPAPANAKPVGGSLWLANGAVAQTGFVYLNLMKGEYAKGSQGPLFALSEPARLRVAEPKPGAPDSQIGLALRYTTDSSGARLETIYLSGSEQLKTTRDAVPLSPIGVLPRTIDVSGAMIEILAIKDGVLAYRVVRNFPSDRYVVSDLPE
jgi:hypothetical protein